MVNVGGRSKGCSTCRRRRVKCDETRPICLRCQRCGFECSGARDTVFIKAKIVKSRRSEKCTTILTTRDRKFRGGDDRTCTLPGSLGLSGFDVQICICYTRSTLLRRGPIDLALQELQLNDIRTAGESFDDSRIFHRSILSLAMIFFGSQHGQASIVDLGYTVHGVALKQLNNALSDPKCYVRDDVLLSVVALVLLECFVPTGRKYYLKHMKGLEKLLELRGPSTTVSPSVHIYKGVRRMILFASLSMRQPSILARHEWKNVLRVNCSKTELEEQYLFDALADCTVLIAECDKLMTIWKEEGERATYQRDRITRTALDLLEQLHAWRRQWDSGMPFVSGGERPMQESGEGNVPNIPTTFNFGDGSALILLILYNTVIIYVFRTLSSLLSEYPDSSLRKYSTNLMVLNADPLKPLRCGAKDEYIAAERDAAMEICQCVPHVRKSRLDAGSLTVAHLAIRTAWETLGGNDTPEGRWLTEVINTKSSEVFAKGLWID